MKKEKPDWVLRIIVVFFFALALTAVIVEIVELTKNLGIVK
jgi:hypothetical protein